MQRFEYEYNGLTINDRTSINAGNFVAVQRTSGFTSPTVRHEEQSIAGNHGIIDQMSFVGSRIITMEGVIKGNTETEFLAMLEDFLAAYILPGVPSESDDGYHRLTFSLTGYGELAKYVNAKVHSFPRIERALHQKCSAFFFLQLRCKDPRIYSDLLHEQNMVKVVLETGFPAPFPKMFVANSYLHQYILANLGNWPAPLIYRITNMGADVVDTPRLTNVTANTYQEFDIQLDPGEYIDFDTLEGTAVRDDGTSVLPDEENGSEWLYLQPGNNTLRLTSDAGSPEADLDWHDTWISAPR